MYSGDSFLKDFIRYQFEIAKRWKDRSEITTDKFAKCFFSFSGFNALYFLWGVIDKKSHEPEYKIIEYFLRKFDSIRAEKILQALSKEIRYFIKREPIQNMKKRNPYNFNEGDPKYGRKWKEMLDKKNNSVDRLVALGEIIYMIRSNLVHGSKTQCGDDEKVIDNSIHPLEALLIESISMTKKKYPWLE